MSWFDICVIIVALFAAIAGYKTGFVKQLAMLAGLVAGAVLSGKLSVLVLPYIQAIHLLPPYWDGPISFGLTFLVIIGIFYMLGTMVEEILKTVKMGTLNKLAGVALSVTKWMFAVSIVLNLIVQADTPHQQITPHMKNKSVTYPYVLSIAPQIVPFLHFCIK